MKILTTSAAPETDRQFTHMIFCPACNCAHGLRVGTPADWEFNGDFEKLTFSPSLKVWGYDERRPDQNFVCHSFIRDGKIEFLGDCTHALAGQTVDLVDFDSLGVKS